MTHVICAPCVCVEDQSCVEVCPVDAIHRGQEHFVIAPSQCIDCGACIPACPMSAIYLEARVPTEWKYFVERNAQETCEQTRRSS